MNRKDYECSLAQQSWVCSDVVRSVLETVRNGQLGDVLPAKEIFDAQKIIITGCGDSYCAGLAMQPVFEKVAGVRTEVWRCIEFSRIMSSKQLGYSPNTPMVIGISVSGNPARVQEALERANKYHANTILITDRPDSPTAKIARHVMYMGLPEGTPYGPGANSYIGSIICLMVMAIRIGRARNRISQNEWADINAEIQKYADEFQGRMEEYNDTAFRIAGIWKDLKAYDFIGDYADYATAFMGSAKVLEAFGGYTTYDDSEDWNHINFFLKEPEKIGRVIVANSDTPSFNRLKETANTVKLLGSPAIVVTDTAADEFPEGFEVFTTPKPKYSWMEPMMQHWCFALVADYISTLKGIQQFRRDDPIWQSDLGSNRLRGRTEIKIV
ncbi:MAG: SIS domain-containing protein [Oscillospiraceae bacterium]|jgi:glucosamine--fructose-6-phosphate aminotransferase (isomerizing)